MKVNAELWDFPHRMMLKVMGDSSNDLQQIVLDQLATLNIEHETSSCKSKASAKGNYVSVSVMVCVKSKEEVEQLYGSLSAKPEVKVIL